MFGRLTLLFIMRSAVSPQVQSPVLLVSTRDYQNCLFFTLGFFYTHVEAKEL